MCHFLYLFLSLVFFSNLKLTSHHFFHLFVLISRSYSMIFFHIHFHCSPNHLFIFSAFITIVYRINSLKTTQIFTFIFLSRLLSLFYLLLSIFSFINMSFSSQKSFCIIILTSINKLGFLFNINIH